MRQVSFKKEGMQHYLVTGCIDTIQTGYQQRLLQYHDVPYILPCEYRRIDGEQLLYYRLKYRTTLKTILPHLPLTRQQINYMLKSIVGVLETTEEYLLNLQDICWQPEYIFIEADTGRLQFCYMPGKEEKENALRELLTEIIQAVNKKDEENMLLLLQFYNLITEPDCTLEKIKKYVQEKCACPVDTGVITKEVSYSIKELEKKLEKAPENSAEKRNKKSDMETSEEEQPRGLKIVKAFLAVIALINILLIVCLLFNILTYDYMRYLFITMGLLIFNTIIYMNVQKEESPDEMMQAYFEEQENEKWENQEQINSRSEKKTVIYGETTVLSEGEKDFTKELLIEEEEERHLYLEALEQGKYDPIHIHNSVVLGCMEEGCNYILKERGISRMHAKLMEKADGLYLLDLNSTNGTYLNGQMLESGEDYKIEEGDHIAFAKSEFYAALEI